MQLHSGRIPIPDLVVTGDLDLDEPVVDGAAVRLVREITSPSNAATEPRGAKTRDTLRLTEPVAAEVVLPEHCPRLLA